MMRILTAGFDRDTTDQLGDWLREGGHEVLGATGRSSSRTLARVARPDAVVIPAEGGGVKVREWLEDLLSDVPMLVLTTNLAAPEALLAALLTMEKGSAPERPDVAGNIPSDATKETERDRSTGAQRPTRQEAVGSGAWSVSDSESDNEQDQVAESRSSVDVKPAESVGEATLAGHRGASASLPSTVPPHGGSTIDLGSRERSVGLTADQPDLDAKLEAVRFADYYAILEIEPGTSDFEIRQQFEALKSVYTPAGWPAPLGAESLPILEEIAQGIRDAHTVLADRRYRERYDSARSESLTGGDRSAGRP